MEPGAAILLLIVLGAGWVALRALQGAGRRLAARLAGEREQAPVRIAPPPEAGPGLETARAAAALRRETWLELMPALTIDAPPPPPPPLELAPARLVALRRELLEDGYFQLDAVLDAAQIAPLAEAVTRLRDAGWPTPCLFVYDQAWQLFQRLRPLLVALLGPRYRALPDFWAWYLDPALAERGWKPHRDRGASSLLEDRSARSLSLWIALSDATHLNGCIYVLPASRDPNYTAERDSLEIHDLADIRALPAPAGSVLGWTQALLHWGGRASPRAAGPRISVSFEFHRAAATDPDVGLLLDPQVLPPFRQRLRLVAQMLEQYRHMHGLPAEILALARHLKG